MRAHIPSTRYRLITLQRINRDTSDTGVLGLLRLACRVEMRGDSYVYRMMLSGLPQPSPRSSSELRRETFHYCTFKRSSARVWRVCRIEAVRDTDLSQSKQYHNLFGPWIDRHGRGQGDHFEGDTVGENSCNAHPRPVLRPTAGKSSPFT